MSGPFAPAVAALQAAVDAGVIPGAALAVGCDGGVVFTAAIGAAEQRPRPRPLHAATPFDLASLTKVLCATPVALSLIAEGRLDPAAPIAGTLPGAPAGVTALHLLAHSSGLPAWAPLHAAADAAGWVWGDDDTRWRLAERAWRTPVTAPPGVAHTYSDLGFLTLGALCEAVGGDRLDRLYEARVRAPWGGDLRFGWPGAAATEDCPVRGRVLVGEVHDLNAAAMGGIAPHAGLFGSAAAVAAFGLHTLALAARPDARGDWLRRAFTHVGPGSHGLGWDRPSGPSPAASARWPADGVGHLGFTGTSLWLSPGRGLSVALLTHRVHPTVEGGAVPGAAPGPRTLAFRALRPAVMAAVLDGLAALGR